MQVQLPSFGGGIPSVFNGSPVRIPPVSGKLSMAGANITANTREVQQNIAQTKGRLSLKA